MRNPGGQKENKQTRNERFCVGDATLDNVLLMKLTNKIEDLGGNTDDVIKLQYHCLRKLMLQSH